MRVRDQTLHDSMGVVTLARALAIDERGGKSRKEDPYADVGIFHFLKSPHLVKVARLIPVIASLRRLYAACSASVIS